MLSAHSYCSPGKILSQTWALCLVPYFKNSIKGKLLPASDFSILKASISLIAKRGLAVKMDLCFRDYFVDSSISSSVFMLLVLGCPN